MLGWRGTAMLPQCQQQQQQAAQPEWAFRVCRNQFANVVTRRPAWPDGSANVPRPHLAPPLLRPTREAKEQELETLSVARSNRIRCTATTIRNQLQ